MTNCPSLNSLVEFLRGEIADADRRLLEQHLATGCRRCEAERAWLAQVLDLTAGDQSFEFSEEVIGSVVDRFTTAYPKQPSMLGKLRAFLTFDSFDLQPLAGLRNGVAGRQADAERQVLFQTDAYNVDLRFEVVRTPQDGDFENLIGQILPEQEVAAGAVFTVRLLQGESEAARTVTNAQGIFHFTGIRSGVYGLRVAVPEGEIVIDDIPSARAGR